MWYVNGAGFDPITCCCGDPFPAAPPRTDEGPAAAASQRNGLPGVSPGFNLMASNGIGTGNPYICEGKPKSRLGIGLGYIMKHPNFESVAFVSWDHTEPPYSL